MTSEDPFQQVREMYRTQTEYNNSLTFKMFLLQFVNYYSSIFYIAFFKGRFLKNPGPNNEFFGFQKEDCGIRGCFIELSLQLIIIMVGKQAVNAFVEMGIPWLFWVHKRWKMRKKEKYMKRKQAVVQWENDYSLAAWRPNGLFYEYLEMVLQFGFVTIFIAAFPLAPLFALVNNMLEIRLDAKKFITCYRRSVGQRVKNIGIWYRILDSISKLAVITNALIIAFTSTFIDQLFYMFVVSPDGSLRGYLNFTLSKFNIADLADTYKIIDFNLTTSICWYQGYKEPPSSSNKYEYRPVHWHILAFRLAFIVAFENIIAFITVLIRWMIPDVPKSLKLQMRHENYITNKIITDQELRRVKEHDITRSRSILHRGNDRFNYSAPEKPYFK